MILIKGIESIFTGTPKPTLVRLESQRSRDFVAAQNARTLAKLGDLRISSTTQGLPRPFNVVPVGAWHGFWVRTLFRTTKNVLH